MKKLIKSFQYAGRGLRFCLRSERNMRIHLIASVYVLLFSLFFGLTALEYAVLILLIALMFSAEMINTAIEALVNLVSPCYHQLARIAKDVAAGAVFVCAGAAVVVGVLFFWKPEVYPAIAQFFLERPWCIALLAVSVILSVLFIFRGPDKLHPPPGHNR